MIEMLNIKEQEFLVKLKEGNSNVSKIMNAMGLHKFNPIGVKLKKRLIAFGLIEECPHEKGPFKSKELILTSVGKEVAEICSSLNKCITEKCNVNVINEARKRKNKVSKPVTPGEPILESK